MNMGKIDVAAIEAAVRGSQVNESGLVWCARLNRTNDLSLEG